MDGQRPLILIDPICRGSRLQVAANVIEATKRERKITLITRPDYHTSHFEELLGPHQGEFNVVTTDVDLNGAWIRNLKTGELSRYINKAAQVLRDAGEAGDVFFLSMDDYLLSMCILRVCWFFRRLPWERAWGMKYRVEYLISRRTGLRGALLRLMTKFAIRSWRLELVVVDERFSRALVAGREPHIVPDPWFGEFDPSHRALARERYGFADDQFIALVIGRQDERKGLPLLLESADRIFDLFPGLRLFVVGKIDERYIAAFEKLKAKFSPDRLVHRDEFVEESELPLVFASADIVLLPYSRNFTASSGVLPRAVASGVPIVTGSHGLVGHQVRRWKLGEVFDGFSIEGLVEAIRRVRSGRDSYAETARQFARQSSFESFAKRMRSVFAG